MSLDEQRKPRTCFVTIGATAGFDGLISAILSEPFLVALKAHEYTELLIQYGNEGALLFEDFIHKHPAESDTRFGLDINGFPFNENGLGQEMRAAKGEGDSREGMIISHAGSGSILAALRINVPLIVVPNPDLLDDHQTDLAKELAKQGYVIHGQLEKLPEAIEALEKLRKKHTQWPPVDRGRSAEENGIGGVLAEEMGFYD